MIVAKRLKGFVLGCLVEGGLPSQSPNRLTSTMASNDTKTMVIKVARNIGQYGEDYAFADVVRQVK